MMSPRLIKMALIAALLFGCVSHDGTYLPECVAYEGSSIKLSDGQFVWERFTDSVVLDDAGNVVNQHPGYPLQGSYRIAGQTLYLETTVGKSLPEMYLQHHNKRHYLLTAQQFATWEQTGELAACALVLGGN